MASEIAEVTGVSQIHDLAQDLLILHRPVHRSPDGPIVSCMCGWASMGRSFAGHLVSALATAGLFRPAPRPEAVGERLRAWHLDEISAEGYRGPQQPYDDDYWVGMGVAAIAACGLGDGP